MPIERPIVIHPHDLPPPPGPPTAGMDRRQILDDGDRWVGWVRTEPGLAGGWHHHGQRDSYIYLITGTMTIEFGPGGLDRIQAGPGDVIVNPSGVVHREVTGEDGPAEAIVIRVGPGPLNVNVEGPDPGPDGVPR